MVISRFGSKGSYRKGKRKEIILSQSFPLPSLCTYTHKHTYTLTLTPYVPKMHPFLHFRKYTILHVAKFQLILQGSDQIPLIQ